MGGEIWQEKIKAQENEQRKTLGAATQSYRQSWSKSESKIYRSKERKKHRGKR